MCVEPAAFREEPSVSSGSEDGSSEECSLHCGFQAGSGVSFHSRSALVCWSFLAAFGFCCGAFEACSPPPPPRPGCGAGLPAWGEGCSSESHPASGILLKLQALLVSFVWEAPPWLEKGRSGGFTQPQPLLCKGTLRVPGPPEVEPATADWRASASCLAAGFQQCSPIQDACSGIRALPGALERGAKAPTQKGKGTSGHPGHQGCCRRGPG